MVPFCHFLVNSFCCYYSASLDLHRKWHWCKQKVCKKYFRQFDAIFQNNTFCEKESFSLFDTQHIIYEIFCKSLRMSKKICEHSQICYFVDLGPKYKIRSNDSHFYEQVGMWAKTNFQLYLDQVEHTIAWLILLLPAKIINFSTNK